MNKRQVFKIMFATAIIISFSVISSAMAKQPNVIIIFTDDQGSIDMNCYGAKDLVTPNMDRLAGRGVRFTQFYAAGPTCSPSRAGLMTGRTPQHGGLNGNVAPESAGMPSEQVTIAEELKKAGYSTALIGKWHLGHSKETVPNSQGFDYFFGHLLGCMDNYSHFFYWNGPNRHALRRNDKEVFYPGQYFPDLMVKEAGQFMEKNKDRPFFLYFALNNPHYPYQGTPEWLEYYKDLPYPRNLYAAWLSTADERIGRLLEKVDSLGLTKDTIVIFQSDQGHSKEVRAHGGGGSSGPYRGAKFDLYEGGLRIPAMISWPDHLPENEVRDQMATGCDWYPTILELCKLPAANHEIDGKSLLAVIKSADAPSAHKNFNWKTPSGWTAIREGKWKLLVSNKKTELYDIPNDSGEAKNMADKYPHVVKHLKSVSQQYWSRIEGHNN